MIEFRDRIPNFNPIGKLQHQYLITMPRELPTDGTVIVHNHVQVAEPLGMNGFRAWTQLLTDRLEPCACGWSGLPHFRISKESVK